MTTRRFVLGLLLLLMSLVRGQPLLAQAETESTIEDTRRALSSFPWYDAQRDEVQFVPFPEGSEGRQPRRIVLPDAALAVALATALWYVIWALIVLVLVVVICLAIVAFLKRERVTAVRVARPSAVRSRTAALPVEVPTDAGELLRRLEEARAAGQYELAMIYLFSYELLELDRVAAIHLARGKTNRQYLRELTARKPLRSLMEQSVRAFEDVYFGRLALGGERFTACWNRLTEFRTLVGGQPA